MSTDAAPADYSDSDIRPIVRTAPAGNRSLWIFGGIMVVGALLLFEAMDARREQLAEPATQVVHANGAMVTAPPPLALPTQFSERVAPQPLPAFQPLPPPPAVASAPPPQVITRIVERPAPVANPQPPSPASFIPQPAVIEPSQVTPALPASQATPAATNERVLAVHLRNPSVTVPQGTLIPAVLETALDSTRPGGVRAIVQRDVMGFDGTRILIPRGSRLFGEYSADLGPGQKRALIRWTRLTRPDAVIVNLDSPAADPLGRAGVEGKVNSHFFERFGGAILQSVLNIGVGLATRSVHGDSLYLGVPGTTPTLPNTQGEQVQRTLKVRQGTSVSVLVARDLDFSSVEQ